MNDGRPPAGWHPDPHQQGQLRYWDGKAWTQHTASAQSNPSALPDKGFPPPSDGQQSLQQSGPPMGAHLASGGTRPGSNWFARHKVLTGVLATLVVLLFMGAVAGAVAGARDSDTEPAAVAGADEPSSTESAEPVDSDHDGVPDADDLRPKDPKIQSQEDLDTDKDGVSNGEDFRPEDPKVQTQDDIDTDADGVADYKDDFPRDARYIHDTDGDSVADSLDAFPKDPKYSSDTDHDGVADSVDAFPNDPSRSKITLAMENALGAAKDYLDYSAFSRVGLIEQLSSSYGEGYTVADATWAVDQLKVDWKEQAYLSGKQYLAYSSFSRQGLIDQLSSSAGEGFTLEEAIYAVNKLGL